MPSGSKKPRLHFRHAFTKSIRTYFDSSGYISVTTPVRIARPALEDHIDAIAADNKWLRTSPELHMKRLLADGLEKIYQIGPCFRANEFGHRHRCEFTMLEYYQANCNYLQILEFTQKLLEKLANDFLKNNTLQWQGSDIRFDGYDTMSVADAFEKFANCSLQDAMNNDCYEIVLCEQVEPNLGLKKPLYLVDYPAEQAALAQLNNQGLAERWELYIGGLEIANAYSELSDPVEQRFRFEQTAALRSREGREVYQIDEAFLEAMDNMPPCAGVALGIERLLMIFLDENDIAKIISFED